MPTNDDSFPITAAMIAMAWVKPATVFNTGTGETNCTDDYTPRTLPEQAGARGGTSAAISTDANFSFASTIKAGNEKAPYPSGGTGSAAYLDTLAAVECNATYPKLP